MEKLKKYNGLQMMDVEDGSKDYWQLEILLQSLPAFVFSFQYHIFASQGKISKDIFLSYSLLIVIVSFRIKY